MLRRCLWQERFRVFPRRRQMRLLEHQQFRYTSEYHAGLGVIRSIGQRVPAT
jgi:hypothetical protein